MKKSRFLLTALLCVAGVSGVAYVFAQPPHERETVKLVKLHDRDGDGWLNEEERETARGKIKSEQRFDFDVRGMPRQFGRGGEMPEPTKGQTVSKESVRPQPGDLYDTSVLRTIFMDFASDDWETELETFHNTDVEVSATLTVDGKTLPNCGIRFRGASSYSHVPAGRKRSFNVSVDMADDDQRLLGYKTLNLLNAHGDDSLLSTVLYSHIARQYIPAPKANLVRVVVNGEDWGIYTNVEQYNKDFLKANFGSKKEARWKVHGSPRGGGGLDYRGEDLANYEHPYELKSGGQNSVAKLMAFCRLLDETPADQLPKKLEKVCDVDGLLWFLALDVGLINGDGYWVRASDYSIYLDEDDKFHFIPHDMNEAFRPARGGPGGPGPGGHGPGGPGRGRPDGRGDFGFGGPPPGGPDRARLGDDRPPRSGERRPMRGGPERGGPGERRPERGGPPPFGPPPFGPPPFGAPDASSVALDPLVAMNSPDKPLYSKVLAVPKYREQFLANLKTLADQSLNWSKLQPLIESQVNLIEPIVKGETHSLTTHQRFLAMTSGDDRPVALTPAESRGPRNAPSLKSFIEGRSEFLLNYEPPKNSSK